MKINSCLGFALLLLLLVSCALAAETTTQEAKGASDEAEPAYNRGGGCRGGNCGGGGGGCRGGNCGGGGGCRGRNCGGGGGYHCNHGCCKYYGGQCKQCCHSAAEARAFAEEQAHA